MTNFLLILILLAIVLGPIGLIAGLGGGAVLLVIILPLFVLAFLMRFLSASGKAIRSAMPERLPPGAAPAGDHVRQESDGWYCVVGGARFGPWSDRVIAENVMKVEQRRPSDHVRQESDGWYCVVGGARFGPWSDRVIAENVMKVEQRRPSVMRH